MVFQRFLVLAFLLAFSACSGNSGPEPAEDSGFNLPPEAPKSENPAPSNPDAGPVAAAPQAPPAVTDPGPATLAPYNPNLQFTQTPQFSGAIGNIGFTMPLTQRLLIHGSQCEWKGGSHWQGSGKFFAKSIYLCPVNLPRGAKLTKVTLYPHNFNNDEDPLEVGLIGIPAIQGSYTWRSDFAAKAVTLKEDKSGYTTELLANCAVKDWTFAANFLPHSLSCNYTQGESSTLYFNLTGYLMATDSNLTADLDQIPPVANLIEVEYSPAGK